MTVLDTCPKCGVALGEGATICAGCGWDATVAVVSPPRSLPRILAGAALRIVIYGAIIAAPVVGVMRLRSTGPGPDLPTTLRWIVRGDDGRAAELVTIHRAHEIASAAARFAVEKIAAPSFEGDWATTLAPYATMNVRGWMPLLFWGATTGMAPASVEAFYEVRADDGWGRPYRVSARELGHPASRTADRELAADLAAGLQSSFFEWGPRELDPERDWLRVELASAGRDAAFDTADDIRFISYLPIGITLRFHQRQEATTSELERAFTLGRHHFRLEGNRWDLIDARLLAEFRLELLR
ncbi:MAG TPA: hypothetical protein PKJ99_06345 [Thermoanaerobaculales bacterium]|nr:hypothetical protein [Thermoanaerobaculales bacterium]HPA80768.1 hypothetical protein [Thermoanaerobaculales bacterium]HQL29862.1 hypothetical protein [Thermoanaerobaculales bacterium]HQN96784.1 hypothetical protein [Thermoanaerobaculales bacterium]